MNYRIAVSDRDSRDITARYAYIVGIGDLTHLTASETATALSRITANDYDEAGNISDERFQALRDLGVAGVISELPFCFITPDGNEVCVDPVADMDTLSATYAEMLTTFRDLLEPENLAEGLGNEYIRGGVGLMADVFGVINHDTGDRMEDILSDLRAIPQFTKPDRVGRYGVSYQHDPTTGRES